MQSRLNFINALCTYEFILKCAHIINVELNHFFLNLGLGLELGLGCDNGILCHPNGCGALVTSNYRALFFFDPREKDNIYFKLNR